MKSKAPLQYGTAFTTDTNNLEIFIMLLYVCKNNEGRVTYATLCSVGTSVDGLVNYGLSFTKLITFIATAQR